MKRFFLSLNVAVYKNYVRRTILYGSECWCLIERMTGILRKTEQSMVIEMC